MKTMAGALLLLVIGCGGGNQQREAEKIRAYYQPEFDRKCAPLYRLALTHTDSLIVHAHFVSNYHTERTCLDLAMELHR